MDIIKILAIAPYEGMKEILNNLADQNRQIDLTCHIGDLQKGVEIVQENADNGFDVIISRGGTAELIRQVAKIPVIEIPLSVYDILRAIKLAENYSEKFAIIGFPSITKSACIISDLLQMNIDIVTISKKTEVEPFISRLKQDGYGIVLCDAITHTIARKIGLNAILITSGYESIESAIEQSIGICRAYSLIRKQYDIAKTALDESQVNILIFDETLTSIYYSLPDTNQYKEVFEIIRNDLPNFKKSKTRHFEFPWMDNIVSATYKKKSLEGHTYIYVFLKFNPFPSINDTGVQLINRNNDESYLYDTYYSNTHATGNILTTIEKYAKTTLPILILGEQGSGKSKAASLIFENSPYHDNAYYIIDCQLITDKQWHLLSESSNSPFSNLYCTIYFKDINYLEQKRINQLFSFFESTSLQKRNQLIFSYVCDISQEQDDPIISYLLNQLSCLSLRLPALRDRTEDIPSLSTLYINKLNAQFGKQIIGFEPGTIERLQNFQWPQNFDQLKRVLKELVVLTDTSYISEELTALILRQEEPAIQKELSGHYSVNLNQSLNDINYDIIRIILHEKGMNQSRVAKQLGISRSTLWRLLKSHEDSKT